MKKINVNGTRAFVGVIVAIIAGLGLGWKVVDSRINSEVKSLNARMEWTGGMIDDRIKVFEERVYLDSQRLARIEENQKHMKEQLDRIQEKLDDL